MMGMSYSINGFIFNVRARIGLMLVRVAYRIKFWVHKRRLRTHSDLHRLLNYQIRLTNPDFKSEGYSENADLIINTSAWKLTKPALFEEPMPVIFFEGLDAANLAALKIKRESIYAELREKYQTHRVEVDALLEQVRTDRGILQTLKNMCLVDNLINSELNNTELAKYYLGRARDIDANSSVLTPTNFEEIRKQAKAALKKHRNKMADREATKLSITSDGLSAGVAIVSALFLVSGYLHERYYLSAFGVEVSKYYTISDYLAASIESIRHAAFGGFLAVFAMFVGYNHASRKSYAELEYERKRKDYFYPSFLLILGAGVAASYYADDLLRFYNSLLVLAIFVCMPVSGYLSRKFFSEPTPALFGLVFVSLFFAHLYYSAASNVYKVGHKVDAKEKARYEYIFSYSGESAADLVLLTANSGYYFFWDNSKNKTYIFPKDAIRSIAVVPEREETISGSEAN